MCRYLSNCPYFALTKYGLHPLEESHWMSGSPSPSGRFGKGTDLALARNRTPITGH
jgi:hypothetical protein